MSYKFNPEKCLAVVAAWPDLQVSPQLVAWLKNQGVETIQAHRFGAGNMALGYNNGVEIALRSKFNQFIFADRDMWPGDAAIPFLQKRGDVVACEYNTGHAGTWDADVSFHTGLWRTRRKVLRAVGLEPFKWTQNEKGTATTECLCQRFARRVLAAGFTVTHAGDAMHVLKVSPNLPMWTELSVKK